MGRSTGEGIGYPLQCPWASLVVQLVKNLPEMQEMLVKSLDWEDPLEKGKAGEFQPGGFYSGQENSMDCVVHEVTKTQTTTEQLSRHCYVTRLKTYVLIEENVISNN